MLKADNIKTITDMRQNTLALLEYVQKSDEPVIILQRSKPKGVLLGFEKYQKMVELIEDYLDTIEAEEVLSDKKTKFVELNKFWKKYNLC